MKKVIVVAVTIFLASLSISCTDQTKETINLIEEGNELQQQIQLIDKDDIELPDDRD